MGEALLALLTSTAEILSTSKASRWFFAVCALVLAIALVRYFGIIPF